MLAGVAGEVFVRARPFLKLMARAIPKQPSGTLEKKEERKAKPFLFCSLPLRPMEFHPFEPHSLHLFLSVIDGRHS